MQVVGHVPGKGDVSLMLSGVVPGSRVQVYWRGTTPRMDAVVERSSVVLRVDATHHPVAVYLFHPDHRPWHATWTNSDYLPNMVVVEQQRLPVVPNPYRPGPRDIQI